jgi:hypothetical protein
LRGVFVMRKSNWTPSIVPNNDDQNVFLVIVTLVATVVPGGKLMSRQPTLKR